MAINRDNYPRARYKNLSLGCRLHHRRCRYRFVVVFVFFSLLAIISHIELWLELEKNVVSIFSDALYNIIPNTAVLGPTNFIGITITATARMTAWMKNEDFYGGRTGPLEKFYLFIFFYFFKFLIF